MDSPNHPVNCTPAWRANLLNVVYRPVEQTAPEPANARRHSAAVIAAEHSGRRCHGLEVAPVFVDTAISRWQRLAGKSTCHALTGRSLNGLVREAEVSGAA
jgi:hypothetical protein